MKDTNQKSRKPLFIKLALALMALYVATSSFYTLNETERVVISKFGKPAYEVTTSGPHGKWPWPINSMTVLDKRLIAYNATPREIITGDKKTMLVDMYAYYQIVNGIAYVQSTQTEENASARVDEAVYSQTRNAMGKRSFDDILVKERISIMDEVTGYVGSQIGQFGLTSSLVRMSTANLPKENKQSVYNRMIAERERQAKTYRSEGQEESTKIRAATDREVAETLSAADKEAEKVKGEGDGEASRVYNEVYSKNPDFFRLYRSLQAADKTLGNTKFVFNGDEPHLRALLGKQ